MMPSAIRVEARAHSRATEILERVVTAVLNIFPDSLREKVVVSTTDTEGYGGLPIVVVTAVVEGEKAASTTLSHILKSLTESDREWLANTLERRVDEKCTLFLRADKQDAFRGRVSLATGPDIISIQVQFQDHPRCQRGRAVEFIREAIIQGAWDDGRPQCQSEDTAAGQ